MTLLGWEQADVILFTGDAYIDHPSFGAAVIGRILEKSGLKVAVVPQPNWRDDLRDFKKLGEPKLFFGVTAGAMDSMINHYTANKRLRSDDAYTPDGKAGMRPDKPTVVYSQILKKLFPNTPIVLGGIEASLRRITHYDYWEDQLKPSILIDAAADLLVYGMGELPLLNIVEQLQQGKNITQLKDIPQTAYLCSHIAPYADEQTKDIELFSHEECLIDKLKQAKNFRIIEEQSNMMKAARILQRCKDKTIVINPPYPPMTEEQIDASFDLPYTRLPHPKYKNKTIPAFEMIKFSINIHRGCFGGCSFCTISAHQGKFIASRSKESVVNEVKKVVEMPDFKGYLSDLGGPSANMYQMKGFDTDICAKCKRPSCVHPNICKNLNTDHAPLLDIYRAVDKIPGIKKSFVSSGIRYDLMLHRGKDNKLNETAAKYTQELISNHVSGRLKVAPEHTSDAVLKMMRKPSFDLFYQFKKEFETINQECALKQQLIPYFISSHPGCAEEDMADLAIKTKNLNFHLEQVQDFTPSPMTLATEIYYTGYHPYTLKPVYTARTKEQKLSQRQFFFWYNPQHRSAITRTLQNMQRPDLLQQLYGNKPPLYPQRRSASVKKPSSQNRRLRKKQ